MNATATPPPVAEPRPPLLTWLFGIAVRLAMMLAMVAGGWMLIQTYRDLFTPPNPGADSSDAVDPPTGLAADLWQPGAWSFGDVAWALRHRDLNASEVDRAFASRGDSSDTARPLVELERDVLVWLRRTTKNRPETSGQVYESTQEAARVRAVTTGQGDGERLLLLQVGWAGDDSTWTLIELNPTSSAAPKRDVHLLPLGSVAHSQARRWGEGDRLSAELIKSPKSLDHLLTSWQRQGWTVSDRHDVEEGAIGFFLTKGDRAIQGWKLPIPAGPADGCILLIDHSVPQPQRRER